MVMVLLLPAPSSARRERRDPLLGRALSRGVLTCGVGKRLRQPFVEKRERFGSLAIPSVELADMEPGVSDQGIDPPIQVAATSQPMPQRVQSVLPRLHAAVRREAMLDEDEVTIRLQ